MVRFIDMLAMYTELLVYFSISFSFSLLSGYSQFATCVCLHMCTSVCMCAYEHVHAIPCMWNLGSLDSHLFPSIMGCGALSHVVRLVQQHVVLCTESSHRP